MYVCVRWGWVGGRALQTIARTRTPTMATPNLGRTMATMREHLSQLCTAQIVIASARRLGQVHT